MRAADPCRTLFLRKGVLNGLRATKAMKWEWLGLAVTLLVTCGSCEAFFTASGIIPRGVTLKNRLAVGQPNLRRPRPYYTSTRDRQEEQTLHATSSNWFAQASLCRVSMLIGESCDRIVSERACCSWVVCCTKVWRMYAALESTCSAPALLLQFALFSPRR